VNSIDNQIGKDKNEDIRTFMNKKRSNKGQVKQTVKIWA
jgi:hypothetical protein